MFYNVLIEKNQPVGIYTDEEKAELVAAEKHAESDFESRENWHDTHTPQYYVDILNKTSETQYKVVDTFGFWRYSIVEA